MAHYIATFYTHYGAMKFFKEYKKRGVPAKLMPVPRSLSASCGVCVRFEAEKLSSLPDGYDLQDCYVIEKEKYIKIQEL